MRKMELAHILPEGIHFEEHVNACLLVSRARSAH